MEDKKGDETWISVVNVGSGESYPRAAKDICDKLFHKTPDLLLSFVTGPTENGPFQTVPQRNAFQEGIHQIVAKLPGCFFFSSIETVGFSKFLSTTLRGLDAFGKHAQETGGIFGTMVGYRSDGLDSLIGFWERGGGYGAPLRRPINNESSVKKVVFMDGVEEDRYSGLSGVSSRAEIEVAIWRHLQKANYQYDDDRAGDDSIHFAVAFMQGGIEQLAEIAVYLKNKIPVVILEGCGGSADLLAAGLRLSPVYNPQQRRAELKRLIAEFLPDLSGKNDEELLNDAVDVHMAILKLAAVQDLSLIAVISPRNLANLDSLVVDAVVKASAPTANQNDFESNLILGVKANRPAVVQSVLLDNPVWEDMQIPYRAFEDALVLHNRAAFVDLFLHQNFNVQDFLDTASYLRLFQRANAEPFFHDNIWVHILGHSQTDPVTEKFLTKELNALTYQLSGIRNYLDLNGLDSHVNNRNATQNAGGQRKAINALAVFAALMGDDVLVEILIKHCYNPVPLALFVETMFRGISANINDQATQKILIGFAAKMSKITVGLLDMAVQDNEQRARTLLVTELPDYNMRTVLRLAYDAKDRAFIAHPTVQEFLDSWFYGFISIKGDWHTTKLIASAFLPFLMSKWLSFPTLVKPEDRERPPKRQMLYQRPTTDQDKKAYVDRAVQKRLQEPDSRVAGASKIPFSRKIYNIWNAPAVKFHVHQWFYWAFLILLAVALMLPACRFVGVDIAVFVLAALRWLELLFKFIYDSKSLPNQSRTFALFELIYEGVFTTLFFAYRIFPFRYDYPYAGRIILSFGVLYYYYRVWDLYYYMDGILGPSIRMIMRSFRFDLVRWLLVTYQLFIAAGLVWQAIAFPDWPATGDDWRKMFYRAMFSLFGAFYNELEYTPTCEALRINTTVQPLRNPVDASGVAIDSRPPERCWIGDYSDYSCATVTVWSYFFYLSYYFFVLLGTLLMLGSWIFTRFIDEWAENAVIWKYHRCRLIMDYGVRSCLPPPLGFLGYLFNLFKKQTVNYVDNQPKTGLKRMMEAEPLLASVKAGALARSSSTYWVNLAQQYFRNLGEGSGGAPHLASSEAGLDRIAVELDALVKVTLELDQLLGTGQAGQARFVVQPSEPTGYGANPPAYIRDVADDHGRRVGEVTDYNPPAATAEDTWQTTPGRVGPEPAPETESLVRSADLKDENLPAKSELEEEI